MKKKMYKSLHFILSDVKYCLVRLKYGIIDLLENTATGDGT